MELHIQSHHWERRTPDWSPLPWPVSGGALVIALEFVWSTLVLGSAVATDPQDRGDGDGRSALGQMTQFNLEIVAMALLLHYVLGAIMGMMLAAIMAPFRLDSSVGMEAAIGLAFGIVAYGWNFYVMTAVFPWFVSSAVPGLLANLLFGVVAAITYGRLERLRKQNVDDDHRVSRRAA